MQWRRVSSRIVLLMILLPTLLQITHTPTAQASHIAFTGDLSADLVYVEVNGESIINSTTDVVTAEAIYRYTKVIQIQQVSPDILNPSVSPKPALIREIVEIDPVGTRALVELDIDASLIGTANTDCIQVDDAFECYITADIRISMSGTVKLLSTAQLSNKNAQLIYYPEYNISVSILGEVDEIVINEPAITINLVYIKLSMEQIVKTLDIMDLADPITMRTVNTDTLIADVETLHMSPSSVISIALSIPDANASYSAIYTSRNIPTLIQIPIPRLLPIGEMTAVISIAVYLPTERFSNDTSLTLIKQGVEVSLLSSTGVVKIKRIVSENEIEADVSITAKYRVSRFILQDNAITLRIATYAFYRILIDSLQAYSNTIRDTLDIVARYNGSSIGTIEFGDTIRILASREDITRMSGTYKISIGKIEEEGSLFVVSSQTIYGVVAGIIVPAFIVSIAVLAFMFFLSILFEMFKLSERFIEFSQEYLTNSLAVLILILIVFLALPSLNILILAFLSRIPALSEYTDIFPQQFSGDIQARFTEFVAYAFRGYDIALMNIEILINKSLESLADAFKTYLTGVAILIGLGVGGAILSRLILVLGGGLQALASSLSGIFFGIGLFLVAILITLILLFIGVAILPAIFGIAIALIAIALILSAFLLLMPRAGRGLGMEIFIGSVISFVALSLFATPIAVLSEFFVEAVSPAIEEIFIREFVEKIGDPVLSTIVSLIPFTPFITLLVNIALATVTVLMIIGSLVASVSMVRIFASPVETLVTSILRFRR